MNPSRPHRRQALSLVSLVLLVGISACVDAPSAPEGSGVSGTPFVVAPVFSLVGPAGSGPVTGPQASALGAAFDKVDRFRLVVKKVPSGETATDTVLTVSPGQDEYDLSVNVDISGASEQFTVTITALQGDVELFTSDPITVTATPQTAAGAPPPTAVNVTMRYSGPGATATSVVLSPAQAVLAPTGAAQFTAAVMDQDGEIISGVPLAWTTDVASVATVGESGLATAVGDGATQVTVSTPTGLEATGWVYVVSGTLAFVQDGVVKTRAPAGGEAADMSSGGDASGPAWSGGDLYYAQGGVVYKAGSSTELLHASWPSVSPDGGKIAGDAGGSLAFANIDGTNETPGPSGTTPSWTDWSTLVVGGGSIQQVQANGDGRTTLVEGDASLPALSSDGSLAYVSGGKLMVQGNAEPLADVGGRPSWSPNGSWIVAPGDGGLLLVATSGSAPPVALPGTDGASDPAWQGTAVAGGGPPPLSLTRMDPDPAIPGQEVTLVGSGFDLIIPKNNKIFWPGPDGEMEGEVLSVSATELGAILPRSVVAGQIRVQNGQGQAVLEYVPSVGSLEVRAKTPYDAAVAGVGITLLDSDGNEAASGATDDEGFFAAEALLPGSYTLQISAPEGFTLEGDASRSLTIAAALSTVDVTLRPSVASVVLDPASPTLGIFDEIQVSVTPLDVNGNVVSSIESITWASGTSRLDVWDGGLINTIVGRQPSTKAGDAAFSVTLDGKKFGFGATVTSSISGTVTSALNGSPVEGVPVVLYQGGAEKSSTTTDNAGRYSFGGLFAGTYTVKPMPKAGSPSPSQATVTLEASNPRGGASFTLDGSAKLGFESGTFPAGSAADGFWNVTTGAGIINVAVGTSAHLAPDDVSDGALPAAPEGQYYLWYGQPGTGHFDNGSTNSGSFTAPAWAVPAGSWGATFKYWYEVESVDVPSFDLMTVDVIDLTAGTTTQVLLLNPTADANGSSFEPYTSSGYNLAPTWQTATMDLSAYAGHDIQLRFNFDSGDSAYNYFRGWAVDDIRLAETAPTSVLGLSIRAEGSHVPTTTAKTCSGTGCDPRADAPAPVRRQPLKASRR